MKRQLITTTLGSLMVSALLAHAQDAAPATAAPETPASTPAPAAIVADATTAQPAAEAAPAPATAPAAAPAAASTESKTGVNELIVIDDTPLLDAIRNLARQAGLNLMIDPKVAYGQPDPTKPGSVTAQPNVSIRWENITAEQALGALLNNYGLQAVEDPKVKITRVTVKDPAAPDPLVTETIQLKFAAPSNVVASVMASLSDKRSKVVADTRTSQLVVVATEKEIIVIKKLVEQLDSQTKQVLIEAKLFETSMNPKTVKGIDWSSTLSAQNVKFGNASTYKLEPTPPTITPDTVNGGPPTVTPGYAGLASGILGDPAVMADTANGFGSVAFLNADGMNVTLSFLNNSSDAKVIASPRAVTLDNETAELSVTRAVPIFKNTAGTQGSPGGSEVTYTNLGVILNVTPRISANNFVNLRVEPEVSSIFRTVTKTVSGTINQADEYDIRRLKTTVMIPSANTLVLGGLVRDSMSTGNVKVPILGDLPVIGLAFRKDSKERLKSNLLIFITPTIVTDSDYHPTTTDFMKSKGDDIEDAEWNAWDSGKPVDWSKPKDKPAAK